MHGYKPKPTTERPEPPKAQPSIKHHTQEVRVTINEEPTFTPAKNYEYLVRQEILFFSEMLRTPNLDKKNIDAINDTIRHLLHKYNNPKIIVGK